MGWLDDPAGQIGVGGTAGQVLDTAAGVMGLDPAAYIGGLGPSVSAAGDWLADKTKTFQAGAYPIDRNDFLNPYVAGDKAAWSAAAADAQGRMANPFRTGQQDYVAMLQAAARGEGPSVADTQNKLSTERNLNAAAALQASQRGVNAGTAARQLQDTQASINAQSAQDAMLGRVNEQMGARSQLGGALASGRQGDVSQMGLNDEMARYFAGLGAQTDLASYAGQQAYQGLQVQQNLGIQGINAQAAAAKDKFWSDLAGGLLEGGGKVAAAAATPAAAASDIRLKENVAPAGADMYDFLDKIHADSYDYKNPRGPGAAPGRQYGVMAQDLEQSPVGKAIVVDTPQGKMVDTTHGFGAILAAQANLHDRLKRLEATTAPKLETVRYGRPYAPASAAEYMHFINDDQEPSGAVPVEAGQASPSIGRRVLDWLTSGNPGGVGVSRDNGTAGMATAGMGG